MENKKTNWTMFPESGRWYKGNLHMHTTESDGRLSPDMARQIYKAAGYDFIAITDHWHISENSEPDNGFLELSGAEYDTGNSVDRKIFHILGIGMIRPAYDMIDHNRPVQEIIHNINEAGGLAILAHPAWSVMNPEDIKELLGIIGAEIYNSVSDIPYGNARRADSSIYFDLWADHGYYIPAMAADDSHYYKGEETKSYIMVKADKLTRDSIMEALSNGYFYASQGPFIENIEREGDRIVLRCSKAQTAVFCTNNVWSNMRVQDASSGECKYFFSEKDKYVRVELIDEAGRMAWSSAIGCQQGLTAQI